MRNSVVCFFTVFFALILAACEGFFQGDHRAIHFDPVEVEKEMLINNRQTPEPVPGSPGSTEYIEKQVENTLKELATELESKVNGESITQEIEVDGSKCTVTLRKDRSGYDVNISGVNLTNEHALKGLLRGMQQGIPDQKPIYIDFTGCYGEYLPPVVGRPEVDKRRFYSVTLPDTVVELFDVEVDDSDPVRAFEGFVNLQKISAPGVTKINEQAFYKDFPNLIEANFPAATEIGDSAFRACTSLRSAGMHFPKVEKIGGHAFFGCTSPEFTSANFPLVTQLEDNIFGDCENLKNLIFSPAVTEIGYGAFQGCTSLEKAEFRNVTKLGTSAFSGCEMLTEVNIPKLANIGQNAFKGCTNLESVSFTDPQLTRIIESAFEGCEKLTSVHIPNVEIIERSVFEGCKSLVSVEFGRATKVGDDCFSGCTSLAELKLPVLAAFEHRIFGETGTTTLNLYLGNTAPTVGNYSFFNVAAKQVNIKVSNGAQYDGTWQSAFKSTNSGNINISVDVV